MYAEKCVIGVLKTLYNSRALENFWAGGNWDKTPIEQWKEYKQRTGLKFEIVYE